MARDEIVFRYTLTSMEIYESLVRFSVVQLITVHGSPMSHAHY